MKNLKYKKNDITDKVLKKDVSRSIAITSIYFIVFQLSALISSFAILFTKKESEAAVNNFFNNSGLPYLIAVGAGLFVIFVNMTPKMRKQTFASSKRKLTAGVFFSLVTIIMTSQIVLGVYSSLFEHVVNLIGYSSTEQLKEATDTSQTISMLLYAGIFGPVTEEIVFRGFLLRSLEKYGQGFAIILSAYMFGLYHSNFIQTPFAFVVGLILGYVALTYGIKWSILLHIFNNLVLGDMFSYILQNFSNKQADIISNVLVWIGGVIGITILWFFRRKIRNWYRNNKPTGTELKLAFTRKILILITIIIFIISCTGLDKI
ncbi:CAAX amino protease [Liquorilactobacillus mali KCTC 3596 = DSM 20444]|uniref:CAAX amino protease n=1 Tax=Liquorilactobacillus mali KCTC 3596 = DSM 20444 TaxID=1046596 RepID=A0A0R2EAX7_9LACO|nr:type II CAAX endopeptidase family protein [Liquorilactobacillus mali]KRN09165.1 CAAX amino protease [Liquorilactobacillus mali KCTC 3596 = DSM 20444]